MAMTLQGCTVRSVEMVRTEWCRPDFPFTALWQTVQSGTLRFFLTEWQQKYPRELTGELIRALDALRSDAPAPRFLQGRHIDTEGLQACLDGYRRMTMDLDRQHFFTRNRHQLQLLTDQEVAYSPKRAWALYVYLLLHYQFKPKLEMRPEDTAAFLELLAQMPEEAEASAPRQDRLAISGGRLYRCTEAAVEVYDGGWKSLYPCEKSPAGICVTEQLGVILLYRDGTLADITPEAVRKAAGQEPVLQASARGGHYCLLLKNGDAASNLPVSDWHGLRRVQVGLNSITAIYGNGRVHHCGSTRALDDYTDVVFSLTRSQDSRRQFALLRTGNRLCLPDQVIGGVLAVDITPKGWVYALADRVVFHGRDGRQKTLYTFPEPLAVAELHCEGDMVLFGTWEKPCITYLK